MGLLKREDSLALRRANSANSLQSTGPRTERGKSRVSRNAGKHHVWAQVTALSMKELGEDPADFAQLRDDLAEAMEPCDPFEAAWVEDIAILRWRLLRLQRAEAGAMAWRQRKLVIERRRKTLHEGGLREVQQRPLLALAGYSGLPDSSEKFDLVLQTLRYLREAVECARFDQTDLACFDLLYGKSPGLQGVVLKTSFERLLQPQETLGPSSPEKNKQSFLTDLAKEIATYEQLQSLYTEEQIEASDSQRAAELLPPAEELDKIVRYEAHLENQIERKLRQFYARRREPMLREGGGSRPLHRLPAGGSGSV